MIKVPSRGRRPYLALLFLVGPLGFATKLYSGPAEQWVSAYAGGVLYVVFWILVVLLLVPKLPAGPVAISVLLATTALEFLQIWQPPFLRTIRGTFIGHTLLGSSFSWLDLPHYVLGAIVGYGYASWVGQAPLESVDAASPPDGTVQ